MPSRRTSAPRKLPGRVRIIGGEWRGRLLPVPATAGLRPSPDRVRETLFNWLMPWLPGARCLDLFAGTGVLGFEAISRGAAAVTLVECDGAAVQQLRDSVARLQTDRVRVVHHDAQAWLGGQRPEAHDVVFLDPPYASGALAPALAALAHGWVAPAGMIYLEAGVALAADELPAGWRIFREGRTRAVYYALLARRAD